MGKLNLKRIDSELIQDIEMINRFGTFKTIASCSGHGKYHPTIVVKTPRGKYKEFYSFVFLHPVKRRYLCFYQRDSEGLYFIPKVEDFYENHND